ncbi:hypothetical protein [Halorussus sp. AFM4]|uniref:hypothetical protein n=1 Tax=Halorussus sp. AFM4 TaxID=3421651 RepID=UPI003EBA5590
MERTRRVGGSVATLVALAGVVVASTGVAAAHDLGGTRFDAPIPLPALFVGAGATVALTAAWLGRGGELAPTGTRTVGRLPAGTVRWLRAAGRVGFAALVAFAVVRGLAGRQVAAENAATVFVWPLWLKGVGLVAMLVGSPWRALSPWRGVHALLEALEGDRVRLVEYPAAWGVWPAVVGYVAVAGVVENLTVIPRSPRLTAGLVALYAVAMVLGGVAFGRAWFRRADAFEVLYRQFGRVAPVRVRAREDGYAVEARYPWEGCASSTAEPGLLAFVVAMVYTVSFDGFTATPEYQRLLFAARDALGAGAATGVVLYVAGFVVFLLGLVGAAAAVERIGSTPTPGGPDATDGRGGPGETAGRTDGAGPADAAGAGAAADTDGAAADANRGAAVPDRDGATRPSAVATARAFAPTVVPIAVAYELAHNFPYVVRNLARAVELGLRAVGSDATVDLLGWLSVSAFWGSQVLLVVVGHVVAVIAAHRVAVGRYGTPARARRAHLPLVAVMVGYTVLSLWIISRPVVA